MSFSASLLVMNVGDVSSFHNTLIVTVRALSLHIFVTASQESLCSKTSSGTVNNSHFISSLELFCPSSTQIISRKNPEDVQEVRHETIVLRSDFVSIHNCGLLVFIRLS